MSDFETWWHREGSGMPPLPGEDAETHVRRICEIAWSNGAFKEVEVGKAPTCSASEQNEFETLDEAWKALTKLRSDVVRLRNRLSEHDGCSRWGVKDAIAFSPSKPR